MSIDLQDEPGQARFMTPAELIAQAEQLQLQKGSIIAQLIQKRITLTDDYNAAMDQANADLKALGYIKTRKAEAAGATAIDKPKRVKKAKAA